MRLNRRVVAGALVLVAAAVLTAAALVAVDPGAPEVESDQDIVVVDPTVAPAAATRPWEDLEPLRGVTVGGADFGAGDNIGRGSGDVFSNHNLGTSWTARHGGTFRYPAAESYRYLAERGVEVVRLTFRWERVQPERGAPLDPIEVDRLRESIQLAADAGVLVIPAMMNYGAYWEDVAGVGVRQPIAGSVVGVDDYIDVWTRLHAALADLPNIPTLALMNEPVDVPGGGAGWERISTAVVAALRNAGWTREVAVPTHHWSNAHRLLDEHPDGPWVPAELGPVRYEVHQYWSAERSGAYLDYATELELAREEGWQARGDVDEITVRALTELDDVVTWLDGEPGWIGEIGWPNDADVEAWADVARAWFVAANAAELWATVWTTGAFWRSDYSLLVYRSTTGASGTLDAATPTARVLEENL